MATELLLLEAVDHRIDDYEEQWLVESKVAQLCIDFEESLAGFLEIFKLLRAIDSSWRHDVFTDIKQRCPATDRAIKKLYERWLAVSQVSEEILTFFEGQSYEGGIRGAIKLRQCVKNVQDILARWKPSEVSAAIGHHKVNLDKAQSKKFRELLASGLNS